MLEKIEWAINNGQSRATGTQHTRQTKQHDTISVRHQHTQTHTDSLNKP